MSDATVPAAPDFATNLRRLMTRQGWSLAELILASGLNERTIRGILNGSNKPHHRTLQRLAETLGVPSDELYQHPAVVAHRLFDRRSNPVVEEVVGARPDLFANWTEGDFDNLYSRFGAGGALTREGTLAAAAAINRQRGILDQVALILETREADVLIPLVRILYQRVCVVAEEAGAEVGGESSMDFSP
ncbi:MAG: helix-turn-helix transcriptional regulator [Pirellulales bacterium]|nr:helix-turn-helix transcriptional regulator [Pirellulales bacterium]